MRVKTFFKSKHFSSILLQNPDRKLKREIAWYGRCASDIEKFNQMLHKFYL